MAFPLRVWFCSIKVMILMPKVDSDSITLSKASALQSDQGFLAALGLVRHHGLGWVFAWGRAAVVAPSVNSPVMLWVQCFWAQKRKKNDKQYTLPSVFLKNIITIPGNRNLFFCQFSFSCFIIPKNSSLMWKQFLRTYYNQVLIWVLLRLNLRNWSCALITI